MLSKVVSAQFNGWYPNGYTREALTVGDVRDFGNATSGLMKAGMIEPVGQEDMVADPVKVRPALVDGSVSFEMQPLPAAVEKLVEKAAERPTEKPASKPIHAPKKK